MDFFGTHSCTHRLRADLDKFPDRSPDGAKRDDLAGSLTCELTGMQLPPDRGTRDFGPTQHRSCCRTIAAVAIGKTSARLSLVPRRTHHRTGVRPLGSGSLGPVGAFGSLFVEAHGCCDKRRHSSARRLRVAGSLMCAVRSCSSVAAVASSPIRIASTSCTTSAACWVGSRDTRSPNGSPKSKLRVTIALRATVDLSAVAVTKHRPRLRPRATQQTTKARRSAYLRS